MIEKVVDVMVSTPVVHGVGVEWRSACLQPAAALLAGAGADRPEEAASGKTPAWPKAPYFSERLG